MREPFDVPENVSIDWETGLALNIPAEQQLYPGWWITEPEKYAALLEARAAAGVEVEDALYVPDMEPMMTLEEADALDEKDA